MERAGQPDPVAIASSAGHPARGVGGRQQCQQQRQHAATQVPYQPAHAGKVTRAGAQQRRVVAQSVGQPPGDGNARGTARPAKWRSDCITRWSENAGVAKVRHVY